MTQARTSGGMTYLDHAATTAIRPTALQTFVDHAIELGNPSSLHTAGRHSRRIVEESRESIAAELGVRPNDVVFTSGGTEADNLALKGLFWSAVDEDPARRTLLISAIEHHAVLDAAEWLVAREGANLVTIPVGADGVIDVDWLGAYLREHGTEVAVCAVMWANNETGVIQPVGTVAASCDTFDVPFHCDGVQAVAWLAERADWKCRRSSLAISAHKFGGPVGVGALVLNGVTPEPLLHGGGQEIDVRSGTVATALIASAAAALLEASSDRSAQASRLEELWQSMRTGIKQVAADSVFVADGAPRVPSIGSVSFPGCEADGLLMLLDAEGVACSAGSACTAGVPRPSHVLLAMGIPPDLARSTLRFSFGWNSTARDVRDFLAALPRILDRSRGTTQRASASAMTGSP